METKNVEIGWKWLTSCSWEVGWRKGLTGFSWEIGWRKWLTVLEWEGKK